MTKTLWAGLLLSAAGSAFAQTQGVSKTEIVIGTAQDLSGPIVAFGKPAANGMQMRVAEINEQGGIHGRKIKLVLEDHGYDPKKAVLAAQKMIQRDKIFAMVGALGTPTAMAAMPLFLDKNIPHLFPITAARQMYDPLHKLKYSFAAPYYDQLRAAVKLLHKEKPFSKPCSIYQDDDFGKEVHEGGEAGLKDMGMKYAEVTTYKRGATDFSSQVARMKAAGCDMVVMGTIIRETIGTMGTARKLGLDATFVGSTAVYHHLNATLAKGLTDGLYGACGFNYPYGDDASKNVRDWMANHKKMFNTDADVSTVYGYSVVSLFAAAAEKAGPNLTTASLVKALDSLTEPRDMFGADAQTFTPTKHLGSGRSKLCQIQGGKWRTVTDFITQ